MISIFHRVISIMVMYAIAMHLSWALFIFLDEASTHATSINSFSRWVYRAGGTSDHVCIILVAIASAAFYGITSRGRWEWALLLPQQIIMMVCAAGYVEAVWISQFADGVIRSRGFIASDQLPSFLAAVGHTLAIAMHALRVDNRNG